MQKNSVRLQITNKHKMKKGYVERVEIKKEEKNEQKSD